MTDVTRLSRTLCPEDRQALEEHSVRVEPENTQENR